MLALTHLLATSAPSSTVYLMRHCARATYLPDLYGGQKPAYLANYSDGGALPDWGVAPTLCTARGRKLIQGQGKSVRSDFLARMGPKQFLKVVYDAAAKRDNTTALDLLTGVGLPAVHRSGEPEIFSPPEAWCPYVSPEDKMAAVNAQLASVPKPANYEARIAALQATLGKGVAPPMQDIPDVVSSGAVGWLGGSFVASSWIEAMFLQLGAGLPMAYGRVNASTLYNELLELHVYYRAVSVRGLDIERRGESNLLAHMLSDLAAPDNGVSLYVGHDTNLDGISVMLDLAWPKAAPYPANTTVPGGMLRLSTEGGVVSAAFMYTDLSKDEGDLLEVEALFPNGKSTIALSDLQAMAKARIDERCVRLDGWRAGGRGTAAQVEESA